MVTPLDSQGTSEAAKDTLVLRETGNLPNLLPISFDQAGLKCEASAASSCKGAAGGIAEKTPGQDKREILWFSLVPFNCISWTPPREFQHPTQPDFNLSIFGL